jgi:hypothetical protein
MYRIPVAATDRHLFSALSCFPLQRILAGVCRINYKARIFATLLFLNGSAVNEI